jgi:peptidoglycan/LPS O-acetylase OafA/YrhL
MRRIAELDSLRAIAALTIVVYHLPPGEGWLPFGWAAVDLFFVLSGYLITSIILKDRGDPRFLVKFYARRSLRIWPIYYLTLLAFIAINPLLTRPLNLGAMPFYLTYTQGLCQFFTGLPIGNYSDLPLVHTWTLAIEEHFYILWPILILSTGRRLLVPVALAVMAIPLTIRALKLGCWANILGRGDGLAMGGLLAILLAEEGWVHRRPVAFRATLVACGLSAAGFLAWRMIALPSSSEHTWVPDWPAITLLAFNLLFTSIVGLIVIHAGCHGLKWLRNPALLYIGKISYGLYLYHFPLYWVVDTIAASCGDMHAWWTNPAKVASSLAVAVLSWEFVERPILSLKEKLSYASGPVRVLDTHPALEPHGAAPRTHPVV